MTFTRPEHETQHLKYTLCPPEVNAFAPKHLSSPNYEKLFLLCFVIRPETSLIKKELGDNPRQKNLKELEILLAE